jgi:hypothetical protein
MLTGFGKQRSGQLEWYSLHEVVAVQLASLVQQLKASEKSGVYNPTTLLNAEDLRVEGLPVPPCIAI